MHPLLMLIPEDHAEVGTGHLGDMKPLEGFK